MTKSELSPVVLKTISEAVIGVSTGKVLAIQFVAPNSILSPFWTSQTSSLTARNRTLHR